MANRDEGSILYQKYESRSSGFFIMKIFHIKTDLRKCIFKEIHKGLIMKKKLN